MGGDAEGGGETQGLVPAPAALRPRPAMQPVDLGLRLRQVRRSSWVPAPAEEDAKSEASE